MQLSPIFEESFKLKRKLFDYYFKNHREFNHNIVEVLLNEKCECLRVIFQLLKDISSHI